ncbi:tetratricopeptide repeat protein [Arenibacter sp. F26102]|uniref:tetratricopeptide repeat protein n=1 Tax=Arenibacter sp. F26102 TaxID=2926416 RepID=UPI001FF3FA74|nr:tetratricopeptide repeat protein [Arenibacter sp. F26102]MCK0146099.1 tetratricopeptide repeat protein [Arenibacter sp. F26102]
MNKKIQSLLILLLILIAVTLTYTNHFDNGFVFDDFNQIVDNPYVQDLKHVPSFFKDATTSSTLVTHQTYRPLTMTSLAIDYYLGKGYNPFYFHLSTFLWFLVQLIFMFFLFRKILIKATQHQWSDYFALFAVALYGLHPAIAETINYIYQRGDSLSTLSVVLAFYVYVVYPGKRKWFLYLIPVAIGIFIKEPATMFAPILFFYVLLFESKNSLFEIFSKKGIAVIKKAFLQTLPAFIVCGLLGLFVVKMQNSAFEPGGTSILNYLITQPWVLFRYFFTFFIPTNLSADTDWLAFSNLFDERIYAGLAFVFAMIVIAFKTSKKEETKPIAFGIIWFFISLIPTSSFVPLAEVTNDHRMFFPFVGLSLSVAWSIGVFIINRQSTVNRKPIYKYGVILLGIIILFALMIGTRQRNRVWLSEESLWKDVTIKSPQNGRGLMHYGLTQMAIGKYDIALDYFTKALIYTPYYSTLYTNLAIVNKAMNKPDEAEINYKKAIEYGPKNPRVYHYYAQFLFDKSRLQEALSNAEIAFSLSKLDLKTRHLLMKIYNSLGDYEKLDSLVKETLEIAPEDSFSNFYLTNKNIEMYSLKLAEELAEKTPSVENYIDLSLDYYNHQLYENCILAAEKALELDAENKFAYNNIGSAYMALKKRKEAIAALTKALQIDPAFERAKSNLVWVKENLPLTIP